MTAFVAIVDGVRVAGLVYLTLHFLRTLRVTP
jgi:hypothetical protein